MKRHCTWYTTLSAPPLFLTQLTHSPPRPRTQVYQTFHAPDASTRTSASELRRALKKLGVHLTRGEATALHHDIVANQAYDFAAFCTALLLLPAHNRTELFTEWLEENGFDDGEAIHVPEDGSWRTVVSAGVGSVTSRTLTAPMDRIKILMQAQVSASSQAKAPGIVDVYRRILREGGWRAFWRGNGTNCIKIAPEVRVKCGFVRVRVHGVT